MRKITFFWILACLPTLLYAKLPISKAITLDTILMEEARRATIGVRVIDAETGAEVFTHNDQLLFKPASTLKMFTVAASLYGLGPEFRYHTRFLTDKKSHPNKIDHLYVELSGDPSFSLHHLSRIAKSLAQQGITHIQKGIVLDTSRFEGPNWPPGWTVDALTWDYNPPINAAIIDENAIGLTVGPAKAGEKLPIQFSDSRLPFAIENTITAVTAQESNGWCQIVLEFGADNTLKASGCWPQGNAQNQLRVAIHDPVHLFYVRLLQTLSEAGISVAPQYRVGVIPADTYVLAEHESAPLSSLIQTVLLRSNNIYAESLTKTLGWALHRVGSFQGGVKAMREILENNLAVGLKQAQIKDGSGGSHYDLISLKDVTSLLKAMRKSPHKDVFFDAFPRSGFTGTLKFRLSNKSHRGRFIAKTGTLTGTGALAGIAKTYQGRELVFVVVVDQTTLNARQTRHLIDRICQRFLEL